MNRSVLKSSSALIPLPESAALSTRDSGEIGSPSTSGIRIRIHTDAGPRSTKVPRAYRHSIAPK